MDPSNWGLAPTVDAVGGADLIALTHLTVILEVWPALGR